jgi:hypothetical protein
MKNQKHVTIEFKSIVPNTRLRENEQTLSQINQERNPMRQRSESIPVNSNINTNTIIPLREGSLNDISHFNMNAYSGITGNNGEDSSYINRNFESHLDEIFDNLTYLITSEKYATILKKT